MFPLAREEEGVVAGGGVSTCRRERRAAGPCGGCFNKILQEVVKGCELSKSLFTVATEA